MEQTFSNAERVTENLDDFSEELEMLTREQNSLLAPP